MRILFYLLLFCFHLQATSKEVFRFHLLAEPHSLDPQASSGTSGNYLFHNIYRGLFRYHSQRGLIKEGAQECRRQENRLICKLRPEHRWSNGDPIRATDYVRSLRRLIDPENKSPQSELILTLKNARRIWSGELKPEMLGVRALDDKTVQFEFAEDDAEFEYKLINAALSPWPPSGILAREDSARMVVSGPYQISEWKPGHFVHLKSNPGYQLPSSPIRPEVEAFFIDSDATALNLFETGKMSFLRRLAAGEVPRFRGTTEFQQIPVARFDYIGFGPELLAHPELREALTLSLDYASFQKLFESRGPPGCPSLPARFSDRVTCYNFALGLAKKLLAGEKTPLPKLEYHFSQMGGDDISRGAEWFQAQWKKNLGLNMSLNGQEQIVYLSSLRTRPPAIFRKGVSLDRPTCLAALELFSKDSRENYIRLQDAKFEALVAILRRPLTDSERKMNCRKALDYLMGTHRLIPLGEMQFTILASPKFKGWDLNELNQMDLTDLTEVH